MRSPAWALLLVAAAGCSRCGKSDAASAEELLPQGPAGAVVTAPLGAVAQHLAALTDRLATLPGGEQAGQARRALATQLGFDPLSRGGLASAGLDARRGAAVAFIAEAPTPADGGGTYRAGWVAAVPVEKPDLFLQTVQRLAERAGLAPAATQPPVGRIYEERGRPPLGVAVVRGFGILARGADPAARLAEASSRRPEQSLSHDAGLAAARERLGGQDVVAWAPAGSALPRRYSTRSLPGDVALSVQGSEQGVATRFFAQLPPGDAQRARETLPGGGASLVELLPADAPVRGRLGISPARLLETLRSDPRFLDLSARLHGADAEAFASLAPGVAVSLALARGANIGAAIDYGLDWRRKSPFETVQLVALAEVTDRARLLRALDEVAKALPQLGAAAHRSGDDFQVTYAGGRGARFGVREIDGKPIAYLLGGPLGPGDLRRTPRSANPEASALYESAGAALRVDFGQLAASFRQLPESAYGSGPQAYVARSFAAQVIEPLRTVRLDVAAQAFPDRLGVSLDVELVRP